MRRVVTVLAVLAAVPAFGADWVEVKSPAFAVVSDGGEKDARRMLAQFEQVRAVLKEAWPWANVDPSRPVTIIAIQEGDAYRRLVPASRQADGAPLPAAVLVPAPDRNWVCLRTDVSRFQDSDDTWEHPYRSALHDYVQLLLHLNYVQLPTWLEEGLSEYWGNTIVDGDRLILGRVIPSHQWTLRERPSLPLAKLFAITRGSPEFSDTDRATPFYAEAWALVHLLMTSETRQGQLGKLMDLLRAGRPAAAAVSEAFGDFGALEREYTAYVGRGSFAARRRSALPETTPAVERDLPGAESLAVRAEFVSAAGGPAEAATLAAESIRLDPGLAAGLEARAVIAFRAGRRDEARQLLERAGQMPGASDYAHALLGQLYWEDVKGKAGLARAEAEFQRALELNPRYAKMQESLALVREASGAPADQTIPLAMRASALEPGNLDFRITVIRLMARGGQLAQARTQAERLLASLSGEERQQAEAALTELADPKRLPPEAGCAGGFGPACQLLGMQYRDGTGGAAKDPARAASYFQKGCDSGHGVSCASLGVAYEDGAGVAKDMARAFALYRKACDENDRWACTRLAFALASGTGVEQDVPEAARLLDKSCAAGDPMACAKLGAMLRVGDGLPQDMVRAEPLLRSACDKGSSWGCGELAGLLVARGASQDLQEAAKLLEVACEQDAPRFCAMLAGLLELGHGVARDPARAATLYRRACDGGYEAACAKAR
jgi:TPR repeat protein